MIISKTPYRVSFFGGGTDYPEWFNKHMGATFGTSIDKYVYITCRKLPPFFNHKIRLMYAKIEECNHVDEIEHPVVREAMKMMGFDNGLKMLYDGDLPARSGMGSSSSFTVGFLNCLYAMLGRIIDKHDLALNAIHVEQNLVKDTVGCQDQMYASHGGLNYIEYGPVHGRIEVYPVPITRDVEQNFSNHLMLFFTGFTRMASEIAKSYVPTLTEKSDALKQLQQMAKNAIQVVADEKYREFGEMLDYSWQLKKKVSDKISSPDIDAIYQRALNNGAWGGKLLGAGGGGFMLIFAPPENHANIIRGLSDLIYVPIEIENGGTQILFYNKQ